MDQYVLSIIWAEYNLWENMFYKDSKQDEL